MSIDEVGSRLALALLRLKSRRPLFEVVALPDLAQSWVGPLMRRPITSSAKQSPAKEMMIL